MNAKKSNVMVVGKRRVLHLLAHAPRLFSALLWVYAKVRTLFPVRPIPARDRVRWSLNAEQQEEFALPVTKLKKPHGITWVGRLHNSAEFLEIVVLSWLPVVDELLLIDNCSTDATAQIAQDLVARYPEKIRYLSYPFQIAKPYSTEHTQTPPNSVHSLVYYYERCFAQATYTIVTKFDDDNLLIHTWIDPLVLRKKVLSLSPTTYLCFGGYNIAPLPQWGYGLLPVTQRYSGLIGDIGFYWQTAERFFWKDSLYEKLNTDWLQRAWCGVIYLHVKYCKQEMVLPVDPQPIRYDEKITRVVDALHEQGLFL